MLHLALTHAARKLDDSASFAAGVCRQFLFIFSLNCQKKRKAAEAAAAQAAAAAEAAAVKTRPAPLAESDWETASGVAQRRAEAKAAELRDATTSRTREKKWTAP